MSKKNHRRDHDDAERGESWDSEAQADETHHGNRSAMDRDSFERPMPPKFRQPRQQHQKKK
jgi:hypothetical protein